MEQNTSKYVVEHVHTERKIQRFSLIETDKQAPFFELYNPMPDPVLQQEKRKMKSTEMTKKKLKKICKCKPKKKKPSPDISGSCGPCDPHSSIRKTGYVIPLNKKQQRKVDERHRKEEQKFFVCKKEIIRLPSPINLITATDNETNFASLDKVEGPRIQPEKISLTESSVKWPPEPEVEELKAKIPKSKIYINKIHKSRRGAISKFPESFDFIYNEAYRKTHPWYKLYRGSDAVSVVCEAPAPSAVAIPEGEVAEEMVIKKYPCEAEDAELEEGEVCECLKPGLKTELNTDLKVKVCSAVTTATGDITTPEFSEGWEEDEEDYAIEKYSAATSVDSAYQIKPPPDDQYDTGSIPSVINRILQKYEHDSDTVLVARDPFKRGTLKSHSTSKIPNKPLSFYFGVIHGTIHLNDVSFTDRSRGKQGLAMNVLGYLYSFIKHPSRWRPKDIDKILELGDKLYLRSLELLHFHDESKDVQPEDLTDVITIGDKKIKYKIHDPDIAGTIKSDDPKVFTLLKGLTLFFQKNRSGIFQTNGTNILIWKQKHFYVFDPGARTQELFSDEKGTATLANFYDVPSVWIMLVKRGNLQNWPFILSKITIRKIVTIGTDGDSITSDFREESLYKIINPEKAIIRGTLHLGDCCFRESENRQAFAVAITALVYSHITLACAWHKKTVDKILLVANDLFLEIINKLDIVELKLEHIPAFFTIGPLMVEVLIYASQFAGLMFKKAHCLFEELLTKFFVSNTSAIIEIDKYIIAVWKSRNMFYTFDPYQRNREGHKTKDGTACVTMNLSLDTLIKTIIHNFNMRDHIFKIHILKIVRVSRDPQFGKIPRNYINSEESILEGLKTGNKLPRLTTITVDITEFAIQHTKLEEPLAPSLLEIGSFVGSLDQKFVPVLPHCARKTEFPPLLPTKIYDLDSPSLSDTQIEKDKPSPLREDSFEFRLLEEIKREQAELDAIDDLGEGNVYDMDYENLLEDFEMDPFMLDKNIQKGHDPELGKVSAQVITDLYGITPFPEIPLEPNKPPPKPRRFPALPQPKVFVPEPLLSQAQELGRRSNFTKLPDDSQIIYGHRNITELDPNYEQAAPFVAILAIAMNKKYTLYTWSSELVDAVLDYGITLFKSLELKFSSAPNIEIPKLVIGSITMKVTINYLFDSLVEPSILEACLEKLVFRTRESAIIVTDNYSCTVFYKRTLYYMYDPFGNNLVGLGDGPSNKGVACMFRFKTLRPLISRFMYNKKQRESLEPTQASRFIISTVDLKVILPESLEKIPRREKQLEHQIAQRNANKEKALAEQAEGQDTKEKVGDSKNKYGYITKKKYTVIEGSNGLQSRKDATGTIKSCHFICVCAMIGLFSRPIKSWDTRRVDYTISMGENLFQYVDNKDFADKRSVKNLLFDKHFFDIIIKRIPIMNPKNNINIITAMTHLLQKHRFLLVQFPSCCFVLYKSKKYIHIFDPYGTDPDEPKASWIKLPNIRAVRNYFNESNRQSFFLFYTINISRLKRASRKTRLQYKLRVTQLKPTKKVKKVKVFYEDEEWLKIYPVPWSHIKKNLACGVIRGRKSHRWFNWDIEYINDLYSLVSSFHQTSQEFSSKTRGKQAIANCIVAIIMTEIYDLTEWNQPVLDFILKTGDEYFTNCFKKITETNYQIKIEDFKRTLRVFPYNVRIDLEPLLEGTMFLIHAKQFNLSKALRFFFESHENRCGIVCSFDGVSKTKYVAFGRIRNNEYFMFDAQSIGPPMFMDKLQSKAYILRCLSLNRLLYCLTLTLRHGDFFIYQVGIAEQINRNEEDLESLENITDYEKENYDSSHESVHDVKGVFSGKTVKTK